MRMRKIEVKLHLFFTSALIEVSGYIRAAVKSNYKLFKTIYFT